MDIKIGDLVYLKSCGPTMVVKKVSSDKITCLWFNLKNELQKAEFIKETLVLKTEVDKDCKSGSHAEGSQH